MNIRKDKKWMPDGHLPTNEKCIIYLICFSACWTLNSVIFVRLSPQSTTFGFIRIEDICYTFFPLNRKGGRGQFKIVGGKLEHNIRDRF